MGPSALSHTVPSARVELAISRAPASPRHRACAAAIVEGTSTKLDAAAAAWESQFAGKQVDFSKWLLAEVAKVSAADMLHAVRKYRRY